MSSNIVENKANFISKSALNRIGDKLRTKGAFLSQEDTSAIENWRASHYHVMNAFNSMLRNRAKNKNITIARRHKRRVTIIDKLTREPGMQLARMDDVAGMRLIFNNINELRDFRNSFLKSKHGHTKKMITISMII